MKKIIITLCGVILMGTGTILAHCGKCDVSEKGSEMSAMVDKKLDMMTKKLELSKDQQVKMKAALEKKMKAKGEIKAEMHDKMEAIRADYQQEVKGFLTEKQVMKMEEMKEEKDMHGHECTGKDCKICKKKMHKMEK